MAPVEEAKVVPVEETKEYAATALAEKTETVATYPSANVATEEEVVKSEPVATHSDAATAAVETPDAPAIVSIATVDTHHVAVETPAVVEPVVEDVATAAPVDDLTVEEPKVVEVEPEIVPVEAAPAVIVLDEPAAIQPVATIAEAVVPSTKTETISY